MKSLVLISINITLQIVANEIKKKMKDITKDINEESLESCHYLQMILYVEKRDCQVKELRINS